MKFARVFGYLYNDCSHLSKRTHVLMWNVRCMPSKVQIDLNTNSSRECELARREAKWPPNRLEPNACDETYRHFFIKCNISNESICKIKPISYSLVWLTRQTDRPHHTLSLMNMMYVYMSKCTFRILIDSVTVDYMILFQNERKSKWERETARERRQTQICLSHSFWLCFVGRLVSYIPIDAKSIYI